MQAYARSDRYTTRATLRAAVNFCRRTGKRPIIVWPLVRIHRRNQRH